MKIKDIKVPKKKKVHIAQQTKNMKGSRHKNSKKSSSDTTQFFNKRYIQFNKKVFKWPKVKVPEA